MSGTNRSVSLVAPNGVRRRWDGVKNQGGNNEKGERGSWKILATVGT
jgi:hypothetical protein